MVNICCVPGCQSKGKWYSGKHLHGFPKDLGSCALWLAAMQHRLARGPLSASSVKNLRVCSDHFTPYDYKQLSRRSLLKRGAVPSVFCCQTHNAAATDYHNVIKPSLFPKTEPIPTPVWHQEASVGDQQTLRESENNLVVAMKSEDAFTPSFCKSLSNPTNTVDNETEAAKPCTLEESEDIHSSLVIIKIEPEEQELSSKANYVNSYETQNVSCHSPLPKSEPDSMREACSINCKEEPEPQLKSSVHHVVDGKSLKENEEDTSGEANVSFSVHGLCNEDDTLKSYTCSECGKTFSKSSSINRHMRIHTGEKPFQCAHCDKSFTQSTSLKKHQRTHTGEKSYQCSECGKTFGRSDSLQIHQRRHTGEKPYKCPCCPKSFTRLDILQNHQRTHTGEKPYYCSHCSKTFTRLSVFQIHKRIHTGEKPCKCTICGKEFLDPSNLKIHQRRHTDERPYHCSWCDSTFIQVAHLKSHMRKHTGEKPFHCSVCGKSYTASSTLLYHQRTHHVSHTPS